MVVAVSWRRRGQAWRLMRYTYPFRCIWKVACPSVILIRVKFHPLQFSGSAL